MYGEFCADSVVVATQTLHSLPCGLSVAFIILLKILPHHRHGEKFPTGKLLYRKFGTDARPCFQQSTIVASQDRFSALFHRLYWIYYTCFEMVFRVGTLQWCKLRWALIILTSVSGAVSRTSGNSLLSEAEWVQ